MNKSKSLENLINDKDLILINQLNIVEIVNLFLVELFKNVNFVFVTRDRLYLLLLYLPVDCLVLVYQQLLTPSQYAFFVFLCEQALVEVYLAFNHFYLLETGTH